MLTERFGRAFIYAMAVHGRAERKGTKIPYMAHLLGVTRSAPTPQSSRTSHDLRHRGKSQRPGAH